MFHNLFNVIDDLSSESASHEFCIAIEEAVQRYYKVSACYVNTEDKTVEIVFRTPQNNTILKIINPAKPYTDKDIVPIRLHFSELPKGVLEIARPILNHRLAEMKRREEYNRLKRLRNRITEGVILEKRHHIVDVEINQKTARLEKRYWIQKEVENYRPGNILTFHVHSVKIEDDDVSVYLSRRSKLLPQLMLKSFLPLFRFHCYRRYPGEKSWIITNAPVKSKNVIEVRDAVSSELSGEILEMRPEFRR